MPKPNEFEADSFDLELDRLARRAYANGCRKAWGPEATRKWANICRDIDSIRGTVRTMMCEADRAKTS